MAALGLNAAQGHHEATPRIAPVGTQGHHAGNVKGRDDLACRTDLDALAQVHAQQGVVHQQQAFLQRHAHMVDKLHRRCARAAFGTVDDDEVGRDIGFQHGLDHGKPFPGVTDAELEARGLAAGKTAQPGDELHQLHRGGESAVAGGRNAVHANRYATCCCNFGSDLGSGKHAAMAGFGALAELDLYHLDLRIGGVGDESFFAERAVRIAAAEIARSHFPDQIAAMHAVVLADRAFARIVDEAAHLRALVQRLDGVA